MNISFNGTVKVLDKMGKEIESRKTTVDDDFNFLETIRPNHTKNKGLCDTEKGEYGIHTFSLDNKQTGKMLVIRNEDGDTLLIIDKTNKDGNVEQTTLSNNEINKGLKDAQTPGNFENIILRTASSILHQLKQKVVLPEKAQQFVQEIETTGFKNKPEAKIH